MSENQRVVYQPNETVRLDVRLENETVWLNQGRIGELFGVDRTVVNRHIHNIYKTGELDEPSTCAKIAQVQNEGGRSITRQISTSDAAKFNKQHGGLTITVSKNFHDRFLIIDDKTLYLIGASLKDLGGKCFAFTKLDSAEIPLLKARV